MSSNLKPAKPPDVPLEEQDDICSRYTRGQSLRHIAFALSRDPKTLTKVLRARGITIRPKGMPKHIKAGWYGGIAKKIA